jgi:ABC-type nitrate/sulfonate/bicarbonate transport system permease component
MIQTNIDKHEPAHRSQWKRMSLLWSCCIKTYALPVLLIVTFITLWELLVHLLMLPPWLLPPPSHIAATFLDSLDTISSHVLVTLKVALIGLLFGLVVGLGLAFALDASPLLRHAIYPLVVASQTVPIVAITPLLVIGFGFGIMPKIIVVALVTFFPLVISTFDGLQVADRDILRLLKAMNASRWQQMRLARLPAALPSIFSGLKIAITYSIIGAVIAEWIGASAGLGVYIARSLRAFRTDQVFVAAAVTSLLTIVLFVAIVMLEHWLIPWNRERKQTGELT